VTADTHFPLRTARLVLRPFAADDAGALHAMYVREDVCRYLPWPPQTPEQARAMLERIRPMTAIGPDADHLRLAVCLPAGDGSAGPIIGDVSLWRTSREHRTGEIGFVLHPDHHGQGYGREAMTELLRMGFDQAGFHRIEGRCDARNTPSAHLMEHLGMRREAHLRENEYLKGEWTDELIYAILEQEWRATA
jgi:RimJ/RimL family protein N-acetyltransferase